MALITSKIQSRFSITPYEAKIAELHRRVEEEAKKLQNVIESKDLALREVSVLGEQKMSLRSQILTLEKEAQEALNRVETEISRRTKFVESSKQELKRERETEKLVKKSVERLTEQVAGLDFVCGELNSFIQKESMARENFLKTQLELQKAEKKYETVSKKTTKEKEELDAQFREFDKSKKSMTDMFARLNSFAHEVRLATEYLNKTFEERGVPLMYGLPPDKITKIPWEN